MSIADKLTTIAENQERVFEAGFAERNRQFWASMVKVYTNLNGTYREKTNYNYAFSTWNGDMFYPTENLNMTSASNAFAYFNQNQPPLNLKERLESMGVALNFSQCDGMSSTFTWASISHLPVLDFSNAVTLTGIFSNCSVEHIEKIILGNAGNTQFLNTFSKCTYLKEIRFEGVIGNTISFVNSNLLSSDSVDSIINALMKITDGVARTITLHATVKGKLTDTQIATITTEKGWTLA